MSTSNAEAARPSTSTIAKVLAAACAATSIEWYDFFVYLTAAALVFPRLFFPADIDPVAGVLASFSTAAVGFVARPVGGIVFAHFGDRLGRKPTLVIALLTMGVASTLVGLLPTYAAIGVWAAIALFILRFCQGLAIGGQWGGAVLMATEYAPPDKRGFYGSFAQMGVPVGLVLGNVLFLVLSATLSSAAFEAWGWRVPFLASVVLIGIALYIQLKLEDTPAFKRLEERYADSRPDLQLPSDLRPPGLLRAHRPRRAAAGVPERSGATGALGVPYVLAHRYEVGCADHRGAYHRTDLLEHDVWAAGGTLLGDVQSAGGLFRGFDRLPARVGLRGRARPDHHGLASGVDGHLTVGLLLRICDGHCHLRLCVPGYGDL